MQAYFNLQYKMANRRLSDFGVYPVIGYLLLFCTFTGISIFLFQKTTFAPYILVLIALYFTSKLSEVKRNDFLQICFGENKYKKIRIIENLIVIAPFAIFLIYKMQIYPIAILGVISVLMALLNIKTTYNITIPTPFYKKPFEFTVGFRNTFYLFGIAYILTIIAIFVDNFNLSIFSLMLVFLTVLSYFTKPENEYFVWSYNLTPAKFLIEKIKTAGLFSTGLCAPIVLPLGICYFDFIGIIALCMLLGYLYLISLILAKYAAFPNEMDLAQGIILCIGLVFPPFLIIVIPFFTNQSVQKLKYILK